MKQPHPLRGFRSRKAVSPLVATILLIAFAVALGAVVMNWGSSEIKSQINENTGCKSVNMQWYTVQGKPEICYDDSKLAFSIQNGANFDIQQLKVIVDTKDELLIFDDALKKKINKADARKIKIAYDFSPYHQLLQVKVIPKIIVHESLVVCDPSNGLVENNIKRCTS